MATQTPKDRWIVKMYRLLSEAPRMGADDDVPEGARVIQLSDTLANMLASEAEAFIYNHELQDDFR